MSAGDFVWCDVCRRRQEVRDQSEETALTGPNHETVYVVARLVCDHQVELGVVGRFPFA